MCQATQSGFAASTKHKSIWQFIKRYDAENCNGL